MQPDDPLAIQPFVTREQMLATFQQLAAIYAKQGKYAWSFPIYTRALELADDPCTKIVLHNNLSDAMMGLGQAENAQENYKD